MEPFNFEAALLRRDRCKKVLAELGIDRRAFCAKGFSKSQYHAWFTHPDGRPPPFRAFVRICETFRISPTFVIFGIGPKTLEDVEGLDREQQYFDHIDEQLKAIKDKLR